MSEHRAGQIVETIQQNLINAGVADGQVHRRRIYAFELLRGVTDIFSDKLPAVDVFADTEDTIAEESQNQLYDDLNMELVCDLYVVDPYGGLEPQLDKRVQELRLAIERVLMAGERKHGLDYVIDTNRAGATWQTLEREGEIPVVIYRLTFDVEYRVPIDNPVEV